MPPLERHILGLATRAQIRDQVQNLSTAKGIRPYNTYNNGVTICNPSKTDCPSVLR